MLRQFRRAAGNRRGLPEVGKGVFAPQLIGAWVRPDWNSPRAHRFGVRFPQNGVM
jgi:hypothetical protein